MKIRVLDSAKEDLLRGYHFYEKQKRGLGDYFLSAIFSEIESLRLYAGIHAKVFGYHRLLAKRFPYAIYYKHKASSVVIFAVLDCRQAPLRTRKRLSG